MYEECLISFTPGIGWLRPGLYTGTLVPVFLTFVCACATIYNMHFAPPQRQIIIQPSRALYKWSSIFNRLQRNFFTEPVELRRERQIRDFVTLNGYQRVRFKTDTDVFGDCARAEHSTEADLVVITDQKFSRYPCPVIIEKIQWHLEQCPALYLCLNRHYINIDNSYHDTALSPEFTVAITQWLKKSLPGVDVVDLSLNYLDTGRQFTWAVPDRHYFIRKLNDQTN